MSVRGLDLLCLGNILFFGGAAFKLGGAGVPVSRPSSLSYAAPVCSRNIHDVRLQMSHLQGIPSFMSDSVLFTAVSYFN
jgi:hypothetical protein